MWVKFHDMHSGGSLKEKWHYIYIEANSKEEAIIIFYNRFGHNPHRVTCTCCGEDYSISVFEDLEQATGYDRNCKWDRETRKYIEEFHDNMPLGGLRRYMTLDEYLNTTEDVEEGSWSSRIFIYAEDIKDEERTGSVPEQGFVWVD